MAVSGWWLYSRWSQVREARDRRKEAEMLFVFAAKERQQAERRAASPDGAGTFDPTQPGVR